MVRRSSITQLDDPIQAEVARLIREGWIIDDIRAELAKLGAYVSRSAVGRHVKHARESMKVYAQAQEVSKVWLERLDTEPNGDVARLLPEMLRALAFSTIDSLAGEAASKVKPMDVMLLAKAIKDLSGTTKDAFAIEKARADARLRVAMTTAEGGAKSVPSTMTPEQAYKSALAQVRKAYGLVEEAGQTNA